MSDLHAFPVIPRNHRLWPEEVRAYKYDDIDAWFPLNGPFTCGLCGEFVGVNFIDDKVVASTSCDFPQGFVTVTTLDVPSGKIFVGDSLRPIFDWPPDKFTNFETYNSLRGQAQVVEYMAEKGCAYGPVGNTCPALYRTGEGTYAIANLEYTNECQDTDQCDEDYCACTDEEILPKGWTPLAEVCTDLWAYSIVDYDNWLSKGGKSAAEMGWTYTVVDVPAGRYEFTYNAGKRDFDRDGPGLVIFTDIKYLGA